MIDESTDTKKKLSQNYSFSKSEIHNNDREEFYIFSVGQGNSQLAIYEKYGFAVLYDCGSASTRVHPKIKNLQDSTDFSFIFKRKEYQEKQVTSNITQNLPNKDSCYFSVNAFLSIII